MKKVSLFIAIILVLTCFSACSAIADSESKTTQTEATTESAESTTASSTESDNGKVLVAYFSATGNTKAIAEYVAKATGGDLFEIVPKDAYTAEDLDYNNNDCRANKEQNDKTTRPEIANTRPEVSKTIPEMELYDTVIIGHPIWWGEEPRIIDTFMESYDFSGKNIVSFCTSGSSGIEEAAKNMKALCSQDVNWVDSKRIESNASYEDVNSWISELNIK